MNTRLLFLLILLGLPNFCWASKGETCSYPYEPSNVIESTLRYSEAMDYIAEAHPDCSRQFADKFTEVFRESWLISDGCLEVTIQDVEEALARRKTIQSALQTSTSDKI